jgi:hypothetical protein
MDQTKIIHSENVIDRLGQNIGSFVGIAWLRVQQTRQRLGKGVKQTVPSQTEVSSEELKQPEGKEKGRFVPRGGISPAVIQRAEKLVDDMGHSLAFFASLASLQARRIAASTREGAEDMWAEAQHLRSTRVQR